MALKKTRLSNIINVTGISTVGIFTAGVTQTAAGVAGTTYIKSLVMHNVGLATCTTGLYVYPSGEAVSGAGNTYYRIGMIDLPSNNTFFFEFNYPLVLDNGDKLVVDVVRPAFGAGIGIGSMVNFQIIGDTDI